MRCHVPGWRGAGARRLLGVVVAVTVGQVPRAAKAGPAGPAERAPSSPEASAPPDGLRLPRGTRAAAGGGYVSGAGLRDTTDALSRELARRGISARQIGPYRRRGVELTRFLSDTPSTSWLAIHVARADGQTTISFIPRTAAPSPP